MARKSTRHFVRGARPIQFLTDYEEQTDDDLVIPEDLSTLSDEDLATLSQQATEAFNAIFQDGEATFSEDDIAAMDSITQGIEALNAETATRETAAQERRDAAAALAARVNPAEEDEADADEGDPEEEDEESDDEGEGDEDAAEEGQPEALAASGGRRETRVNLGALRGRQRTPRPSRQEDEGPTIRDMAFAATDADGIAAGSGVDFLEMGRIVDAQLRSFNSKPYANAAKSNRVLSNKSGIASIRKPHGEFMIRDPKNQTEVDRILDAVTDQSRLEGGSLTASGGWCAPSETLYDVYDCGETADGLLSLPTVGISRGGLRFNKGVNFGDLLSEVGFYYTEEEDLVGDYDGEGGGSKPCFKIPCIAFEEVRLALEGLCLTAGLLEAKGYPEVIADTIRKALIAHEIRVDSRVIQELVTGSTAVSLPADQVGATAPILTAVELQAQHYRSSGSLSDNTVLEGTFPQWVRGVIRSDLSRRLGVDLISVPNSRINAWFTERGINPQFVANWQSVATTPASGFTQWPTEVDFMLYKAGTWVKGNSDVITLNTLYDSTLLGTNDYTALFTEEGVLTAMRGCDSRVITVPICPTGDTGGGVAIDCDGSAGA